MKNIIILDVDSERNPRVVLSKPPDTVLPTNANETTIMLVNDIACVCEALCSMIQIAHNNGYANKESLIKECVIHLDKLNELPSINNDEIK